MNDEELQALRKQVKKAKRISSERAGELHDLVEDRLPKDYRDIPSIAQACFDACKNWEELSEQLKSAEAETESL
ncbi:CCE_0567 family metalloprotein [Vibrio sp.]|uniref:Rop family plasmid primer RNA-binding protein n=1 Tax=Vibrio viridaestus TaxID=2487322 RepID=A0A3N9TEM8_9VIBR|nr:CCE_0567 family metalloprotein [Vibrio viridaestus]MDC0610939.1 CCE_0567 family metalloprotein [Vibrio sp.]RQW62163.1 hypothetical protein EES38_15720 [Vibrio viridaestus]